MKKSFTIVDNKKKAFTLAEVLITLGIIGVVAAITMPTLINEYKKQVYVNQLKKAISVWEQGMQKMMVDEGVDKLSNTELWGLIGKNSYEPSNDVTQHNAILKKYFKITDTYNGEDATEKDYLFSWNAKIGDYTYKCLDNYPHCGYSDSERKLTFADGVIYGFSGHRFENTCENNWNGSNQECKNIVGTVQVDINGNKGPNQYGRDAFVFSLTDSGNLWSKISQDCDTSGFGCANRIIENGWKMDY